MNTLLIIVVGGVLGWLVSIIMRTDAQQGLFLNVVVGVVGAMIGGLIISPMLGVAPITSGNFSLEAMLVSLLGAVILLALVNLLNRGRVR